MSNDLRLALRQLRRTPGFTIVVAIVLALGIGVNVATFGAVDALFFRAPSGVRAPEEVRRLNVTMPPVPGQQVFFNINHSFADVAALRARHETFAKLGAYTTGTAVVSADGAAAESGGEPPKAQMTIADASYFATLGARPFIGRTFTAGEDSTFDAAPVAVLGYAYWRRAFDGDRALVGRTIRVNGRPFTVVGIMPEGFGGVELTPADVFLPTSMASAVGYQAKFIRKPSMKWLNVVARLAPGIDARRAEAVATTVLRGIDASNPGPVLGFDKKRPRSIVAAALNDHFGHGAFTSSAPVPLWMLGATGAVLLVVCANVANMLVARAERRRREIATRVALGAGGRRLVRQLLAEGLVLAVLGGAAGVLVAMLGARLFVLVPNMPRLEHLVDGRAALFALAVTLLTTMGFALAPAVQAARSDAGELLRAGVRGTARATPVRAVLLAVQFAASLALLGAGGLFVRSLRNVQGVDVGFDVWHSLVASVDWDAFKVPSKDARALLDRVAERARALPGVVGVSPVMLAPFDGVSMATLKVPGRTDLDAVSGVPGGMFFTNAVDTAYFRTLGIPVLRGRAFDGRDGPNAPGTVVVSETFAKRVFPGEDVIGKCVKTGMEDNAPCTTVVGMVKDARFMGLTGDIAPIYYSPLATQSDGPAQLVVRLAPGTSAAMRRQTMAAIRGLLTSLDSRVQFASVRQLGEASIQAALGPYRVAAAAFTVFGALALLLAAIGLYGVVAYAVAQRTGEFGVRVALGARARDITTLVLRQGIRLTLVGGAFGAAGAVAVGRLLKSRLYGVEPVDFPTLGAVAALLAASALLACWIPARRAARVNPTEAFRAE
ncbi:permease [Gemmatirosa kalamazoonensis]|uniref:Permease n=1 Tax=Gemmatirosa kalamazoonensis TaxID=861299 RepID=W0RBX9_9BACT|nr:ADOP family duplicated permease [Gemmatirosa kalamazoonensis]AHG87820.1 permease [Gemmatirosa kalamazoonensis]